MKIKKGFTLIELLVVVAIIGILASVVMVVLNSARAKGDDAAVKTNLHTIANQAEIFYLNNGNSYLPKDASLLEGPCPTRVGGPAISISMFSDDPIVHDAIVEATKRGNGSVCYNASNAWAVAIGLKVDTNTSWCVDSVGSAVQITSSPNLAINTKTFTCNQPINPDPNPKPSPKPLPIPRPR